MTTDNDNTRENIPEDNHPSPEQQWADRLGVTPPPVPSPQTPPPTPQQPAPENPAPEQPQAPRSPRTPFRGFPLRNETPENTEPMPPTFLVWSILCTLLCCFIPGIVAIFFSAQVSSRYYAGDIESARKSSRRAEIWIIVSFVLGLITNTLYLPVMMFGGF